MNETLYLIFTFAAGLVLGILFFGGLWLTVKKAVTSKSPAVLFLGSLLFRVGIAMLGFYYIAAGSLQRILLCMLGFVTARFIVIRLTKWKDEKQMQLKKEANHEA